MIKSSCELKSLHTILLHFGWCNKSIAVIGILELCSALEQNEKTPTLNNDVVVGILSQGILAFSVVQAGTTEV